MNFDFQPTLESDLLLLRPLNETDRAGLFEAARDPLIWEQHPAKDRFKPEIFNPYFDFLLGSKSVLIAALKAEGRIVGCSRYYIDQRTKDGVGIGFTFLARDQWGGAINFDMKRLMLGHIFETNDVAWFHIDPNNIRSQRATAKLGAIHVETAESDLGTGLSPWFYFKLTRKAWTEVLRSHST